MQSTVLSAHKKQPQTVVQPKQQHLEKLINNAKSVCEYIEVLDYHTSTSPGEHILKENGVILNVLLPKRDLFIAYRGQMQSEMSQDQLDFQELYLLKTLSKLDLFGNKIRVGNCGEKVAHAYLNLLKYFPEEIHSIEEVRISNPDAELDHIFLVLNRENTSIHSNPAQWKAINRNTEVVIVDPSFNAVYLASEYHGNLMMYERATITHSQEHKCERLENFYHPYQPNKRKYRIETHKRFDKRAPNSYFLDYMKNDVDQSEQMHEIKAMEKESRNQFQTKISEAFIKMHKTETE